jgi:quercetin dioxygenase-like cupin family protein
MHDQKIPLVNLDTQIHEKAQHYSKSILENEIKGIHVEHKAIPAKNALIDSSVDGYKTIYLFVKGAGEVIAENAIYEIVPETIFLPNEVKDITIKSASDDTLHYLKVSCYLSAQDRISLKDLPAENIKNIYYAKFSDCQSYSESIKSPNTVSRTILSNEYIPRIAMGTVQTKGPDKVAAHEHPMLEQLFLGLSENNCIVYADGEKVEFPEYSVVHIPLGSSHSVSVEKDENMYYVWMDFFLDKKGEEWLKTHNVDVD